MIITSNRIDLYGAESYLGLNELYFATGPYTIDQYCNIVWNFMVEGEAGVANGVVVNRNQIFMVLSIAATSSSGRLILRRLEFFN